MEFIVDAIRDRKDRILKGFAPKVTSETSARSPPTYFKVLRQHPAHTFVRNSHLRLSLLHIRGHLGCIRISSTSSSAVLVCIWPNLTVFNINTRHGSTGSACELQLDGAGLNLAAQCLPSGVVLCFESRGARQAFPELPVTTCQQCVYNLHRLQKIQTCQPRTFHGSCCLVCNVRSTCSLDAIVLGNFWCSCSLQAASEEFARVIVGRGTVVRYMRDGSTQALFVTGKDAQGNNRSLFQRLEFFVRRDVLTRYVHRVLW